MRNKIIFNLAIYLLFILGLLLSELFHSDLFKILPGALLLYYLPGNNFNDIFFLNSSKKISWSAKLGLDITSSIIITFILYGILSRYLGYIESRAVAFILIINAALFAANILAYFVSKKSYGFQKIRIDPENKIKIILAAVPIIFFIVRLIFNSYVYEIDTRQYYPVYNNILSNSYDASWLAGQRIAFALFMIYSKHIAGMDFIVFFKFFTPILFFLTSLVLFDFTQKIKNKHLAALSFLLIVGSPILTIMNEGVRPETFIFVFILPIFYLVFLSVKNRTFSWSILALFYGYTAYRFHEFGLFLMLTALIGLIMNIVCFRGRIISFIRTNLLGFLLILLPYLWIIKQNIHYLAAVSVSQIYQYFINQISAFIAHPRWDWWFLDGFINFDNGKVGWPGSGFILYYLYNGLGVILLFFIIVYLALTTLKQKNLDQADFRKKFFWNLFPIIFYLTICLLIAEVFPRIDIFLYPNRIWTHIIPAMVFMVAIGVAVIEKINLTKLKTKWLIVLFYSAILSGAAGSTFMSIFMGGLSSPAEKAVIKQIKQLPQDSIVISNQVNDNLVSLYGNKTYIHINANQFSDYSDLKHRANLEIENYSRNRRDKLLSSFDIRQIQYLTINKGYAQNSYQSDDRLVFSPEEKIELIKRWDPRAYDFIQAEFEEANNIMGRPIYFLYSFAKLEGVLAMRQSWLQSNSPQDSELLRNYSGNGVVYKDRHAILVKIK